MRTNQTSPHRHLLAAALAAIIAWPAVEAAEYHDGPIPVVEVTGYVAKYVIDTYQPASPVMVTVANEQRLLIWFRKDETDRASLLAALFVSDSSQLDVYPLSDAECNPNTGVLCCETESKTMVLGATIDQMVGWIRLGELCMASSTVTGVEFVPVPQWFSDFLAGQFGIYHCWARLSLPDRNPRVLVNAPARGSWQWEYCFRTLAEVDGTTRTLADGPPESTVTWLAPSIAERRLRPRIILAGHHGTPPQPSCIRSNPPYCNTSPTTNTQILRCHKNTWHWFEKDGTVSYIQWCSSGTLGKCTCTPS